MLGGGDVIVIHNNYRVEEKENIFRLKSSELQTMYHFGWRTFKVGQCYTNATITTNGNVPIIVQAQ